MAQLNFGGTVENVVIRDEFPQLQGDSAALAPMGTCSATQTQL